MNFFPKIIGAARAKEAWDTFQEKFQGNAKVLAVKLQTLQRNFEILKTKDSKTAKDYYSRVKESS